MRPDLLSNKLQDVLDQSRNTDAVYDSLLSASPALHIRIPNWTEGISCFLPVAISEKTDSLRLVCLFLTTAGKCIRSSAAGAEGAGVGKKPYGLGEEAVFESGSPCSDAPETSPRRQQCEKSTAWVAVVFDDQPMMRSAVYRFPPKLLEHRVHCENLHLCPVEVGGNVTD
ncbi:unnamed protein product [Pleuronectes platessa]|uniref:Uncharacterized protein n=1 Tax=Pleuronectes platessa TaxID=8262 RepID=A0A9N7USC6_PLEPL|nr:unnamed protein product [Pleuronectes platessa]